MMTTATRLALGAALALTLLAAGCGRSVEGETRHWNDNKLELDKYAGRYAGLKEAVARHVADAQKQYDEAQTLTDEEAKTKALALANQKLLQVLTPFRALDKALREVEALKKDPLILKLSAEKVNPAVKLADAGIAKAKALLDGKGVDTSGALVGKIEEATRAVNNGAVELRALKAKAQEKAAKKAQKKAEKAAKKAKEKAETAAPAPGNAAPANGAPAAAPTGTDHK